MKSMTFTVTGIGVWGRALTSVDELQTLLLTPQATVAGGDYQAPKPAAIAAKERRRSGELINLAVEVAHQACDRAGVDKTTIPSVFSSALSDTAVTDYMCRKLAATERMLSPTKFHNSVHNAASGYWSISAGNRAPSTFVSGFRESFGAGLLEAVSIALSEQTPVLYVAYDIANRAPFSDFAAVTDSLATGFVLAPAGTAAGTTFGLDIDPSDLSLRDLSLRGPAPNACTGLTLPADARLAALAAGNLCGAGLTLAEACCDTPHPGSQRLRIGLTPSRSLCLQRQD